MTPFEQGFALGRRTVQDRPLPAELRERLAVLLRPAADGRAS